ncbi:MAG: pectate lyase [Balneolales bacterium]
MNHQLHLLLSISFFALVLNCAFITKSHSQDNPESSISWNQSLSQPAGWYQSSDAVRIGDNVLLYQHESGGWPKNLDMARVLSEAEKDSIRREQTEGGSTLSRPTIDNGATFNQMRFLAQVYKETGDDRYKEGFLQGVDYLLEAQYDSGGWPQYYPIREGYYQRITFNDNAMINVMELLDNIVKNKEPYAFVDENRRAEAKMAIEKGVDIILKTQIVRDGELTAWCAQYDENDFSPKGARSYEHASISGSESVAVVRYLMSIENPSPEVINAVKGAIKWYQEAAIHGKRLIQRENPDVDRVYERLVVEDPEAPTMWARFYEIETLRPIFSGRDGIVRYNFSEIEHERQMGYSWYGSWPRSLLEEEYPSWSDKWVVD